MSTDDSDRMNLENSVVAEATGETRRPSGSFRPTAMERRSVLPKSDPPEMIQIPGYNVIELLNNQSSRSALYLAENEETGQIVAIKQFFEEEEEIYEQEKVIQGILREKGDFKHILLADQFIDEQRTIITPYMRGGDVRQLQQEFNKEKIMLTPYQAEVIVAGACKALERLHACNIVYRDVKRTNMVLDIINPKVKKITVENLKSVNVILKYIDYEIAWHERFPHNNEPGVVAGTTRYLAPEMIKGGKPDPRSDIYALGVVLYQLFTNKFPFDSDHQIDLMKQHLEAPVPDMTQHNPSIGKDLQYIVEKMLKKEPDDRYQTATEVRKDYFMHLR